MNRLILWLLLGIWAGIALLAEVWTPYPLIWTDASQRLLFPDFPHLLGTDGLGRDLLSQIMVGVKNSLFQALVSVSLAGLFGVFFGSCALLDRRIDKLLSRAADLCFVFPLVVTVSLLSVGSSQPHPLRNEVLAITLFISPVIFRLVRHQLRQIWQQEFILAALALGRSPFQVLIRHAWPQLTPLLLTQGAIQGAVAILLDASLSYLGFGVQFPETSLGRLIIEAQGFLFSHPHLALFPGLVLSLMIWNLNQLGLSLEKRWILQSRILKKTRR